MSDSRTLASIFRELQDAVLELSNNDIEKIMSGDYQFTLKLVKKTNFITNKSLPGNYKGFEKLMDLLSKCSSREEGVAVLSHELKNKSEYENFARHVEVAVVKSDKVEKIRDNIIESTVGARLRSDAIQNKN
ncbi:hypothetical protein [Serratia sp. BW106]|uniref:hypothetical protein n=1 Tax=Gammaproteobacteria TaxID=1236 RepID=UPI000BFFF7F2|nr:hypothetical protein [Serratia sp. BW106]